MIVRHNCHVPRQADPGLISPPLSVYMYVFCKIHTHVQLNDGVFSPVDEGRERSEEREGW